MDSSYRDFLSHSICSLQGHSDLFGPGVVLGVGFGGVTEKQSFSQHSLLHPQNKSNNKIKLLFTSNDLLLFIPYYMNNSFQGFLAVDAIYAATLSLYRKKSLFLPFFQAFSTDIQEALLSQDEFEYTSYLSNNTLSDLHLYRRLHYIL